MAYNSKKRLKSGMHTSPWIILGLTCILLIVVLVLAIQNTHRERRYMSELLTAKGAALIRAVEAGARTGMTGMMWGGQQIQRLLEETANLPDVLYMAVIDERGQNVAHSNPLEINAPFDQGRKLIHLGPEDQENWELVTKTNGQRIFEVHRHFRPLRPDPKRPFGRMQGIMKGRGIRSNAADDWFSPDRNQRLIIVIGLDVTPFEEAIQSDIRTTILLSVIMLVLGFGGFMSLFWMQSYRTAKKSLQDTSAFADEVVSHLPIGLVATDRSGHITFFNEAAEQITGLKKTVVLKEKPEKFLPEDLCGLQPKLDQGQTIFEQEMECIFSGGKKTPVSISATRIINESGDFVGQILILRDLSEIRQLQYEIHKQEKLAAMGGLAAGVAHEVRNPLSSIKALATFFAGKFDDDRESREAAEVMVQEVDRLNRVITELLEFAKPSELNRQSEDIGLLVVRSIQLIKQDATNKDIHINLHLEKDICPVWIDPDRIAQCLLNLYINAIQAMPKGGTLTVQCSHFKSKHIIITVKDNGPGIPQEQLNSIYDPYFTTKNRGTGLGLAIVNKIIEAHQGQIDVESTTGQGTAFNISIPCHSDSSVERST